jgi:dUTP pyrophosphatase
MKIKFRKMFPDVNVPCYKSKGAAGMDIEACEDVIIEPNCQKSVHTGIQVEIPEGYEIQVRPRSGMAFKNGISITNSPGTIDSDYRGELVVCLRNNKVIPWEAYKIKKGDRIAQLVVNKIEQAEIEITDELTNTERGESGFGSTGK